MKLLDSKNKTGRNEKRRQNIARPQQRTIEVSKEIQQWIGEIIKYKLNGSLKELEAPNTVLSMFWIVRNLALLSICAGLFYFSQWTILLSAPFAARAIRALGNQVHDAIHRNIVQIHSGVRNWNQIIGEWLLAPVMFYDNDTYYKQHIPHHAWLATFDADPDVICYEVAISPNDSDLMAFWKVYKHLLLDKKIWLSSLIGDMLVMSYRALLRTFVFWMVLCGLVTWILGLSACGFMATYYLLIRATFYHAVKCFAELSDHPRREEPTPKEKLTLASYTRTLPTTWLSWFLYPENDGWHLLHHIKQGIPMPNLGEAHKLMLQIPAYKEAASKYDSFFSGPRSLMKDLIGRYPSKL